MTQRKILVALATITLLLGNSLAVAGGGHGERANQSLDRKGDRIEHRMDRRGDRINARLDRRGDRINHNLDRKGDRIERHARNRH